MNIAVNSLVPRSPGPRLSARSAATFFGLPALKQMQLLREQKYPKLSPQVFKQPYYQVASTAIRDLVSRGVSAVPDARAAVARIANSAQRLHNTRVVEQFLVSGVLDRALTLATVPKLYAQVDRLELRLSADLCVVERGVTKFVFFNYKGERIEPEVAKMTLELAHWIMEENGIATSIRNLEFLDLFRNERYVRSQRRSGTIRALDGNARIISTLWADIEP